MKENYSIKTIRYEEYLNDPTLITRGANDYNLFLKQNLADLNPISAGKSQLRNQPQYIASADCAVLIYVYEESGTLFLNDDIYRIQAGDFFIVPQGAKALLKPDTSAGLPHRWIGITGTLRRDFEQFPVPFTLPQEIVNRLCAPERDIRNLGARLTSDLFLIYSIMQQPMENEPDYVQKVINHINASFAEKISISQIAKNLGLHPSHLSRIFHTKMNMSIRDYILQVRISKAKRYLKHNYSVSETARLCGFSDRANFSKLFHREAGCSPTEWLKILDLETWNRPR